MLTRTFTLTDETLFKAKLWVLAAKIAKHDKALDPVLDAASTWLGSGWNSLTATKGLSGDAVLADMLDGLAFPDDAKLEAVRVAYVAYLRRPPKPDPHPPPPPPGVVISGPNLLVDSKPWSGLTTLTPGYEAGLLAYVQAHPGEWLILADLAALPDVMRKVGWRGRDNALWFTVSRSFDPPWNWHSDPNDPDAHLGDMRQELRDFWAVYLDAVRNVLRAVPALRALAILNDAADRCGAMFSDKTIRYLDANDRVAPGDIYTRKEPAE